MFEADSVSSGSFSDLLEDSVDKFVFGVELEDFGGHEDVSDIEHSLSGVGVEVEQVVEIFQLILVEEGVLGSNVLFHDSLEVLLESLSSGVLPIQVRFLGGVDDVGSFFVWLSGRGVDDVGFFAGGVEILLRGAGRFQCLLGTLFCLLDGRTFGFCWSPEKLFRGVLAIFCRSLLLIEHFNMFEY